MNIIIISILLSISIISLALAFFVAWISLPTKGQAINHHATRRALLVIDLQTVFIGSKYANKFVYNHKDRMISAVNNLVDSFAERGDEVVYIAQENPSDILTALGVKFLNRDHPDTHYDPRIKLINKRIFYKKKGDAFSNKALDNFLRAKQIRDVYLVGIDGLGCVWRTAQGAVNRKYRVYIVQDAVGIQVGHGWPEALEKYNKDHIMISSSEDALKIN